MDFVKVTDDKNINDLLVAINQNLRTTNYMQKEMQKRNISQSVFVSNFSDEEPNIEETMTFVSEQEYDQFENDILYYMSELSSLTAGSSKEEIRDAFIEFSKYPCPFKDCMHTKEKDVGYVFRAGYRRASRR